MNKQQILKELAKLYPRKNIICLPEDDPREIICEIDPSSNHPDYSIAIAIINRSESHIHFKSTETYKVIRGELTLNIEGETVKLNTGDSYTIEPGKVHAAYGDSSWVEVCSRPGWTHDDHILA